MPKKEHDMLKKAARKKGLKGERADAYIYGTLSKIEKARKAKAKRRRKQKTKK
jgi:hypothetical protein